MADSFRVANLMRRIKKKKKKQKKKMAMIVKREKVEAGQGQSRKAVLVITGSSHRAGPLLVTFPSFHSEEPRSISTCFYFLFVTLNMSLVHPLSPIIK